MRIDTTRAGNTRYQPTKGRLQPTPKSLWRDICVLRRHCKSASKIGCTAIHARDISASCDTYQSPQGLWRVEHLQPRTTHGGGGGESAGEGVGAGRADRVGREAELGDAGAVAQRRGEEAGPGVAHPVRPQAQRRKPAPAQARRGR
jgi:hypothetical protein